MTLISTIYGTNNASNVFGTTISGAGDVNGDGHNDIVIGEQTDDTQRGAVFVFYGGSLNPELTSDNAHATIAGPVLDDKFGGLVAGVGDVNANGRDDIAFSTEDVPVDFNGSVFVFDGSTLSGAVAVSSRLARIVGENANDNLGVMRGVGDIDADGKDDLILSSTQLGGKQGKAYVFSGKDIGSTTAIGNTLAAFVGAAANDELGKGAGGMEY